MHDVPKGAARMTDVVRMLHADGLPQPSAVCLAIEELCGAACAAMEVERRFHWVEYILDCIDVQATQDRPLTVEAPLRAVCLGIADGSFGSDTIKQAPTTTPPSHRRLTARTYPPHTMYPPSPSAW